MRRMMLLGALLVTGAVGIFAGQATQTQPNTTEIEKVRDNLFMIKGGGGNTAAFITAGGVVLVDTKYPNWGQAIMDKVRSVTDKPITTIINTHTHGDHTGSNDFFPASIEVVAHENTKTNMVKMKEFQGEKAQFLPDRTYADRLTLLAGQDRIDLYYFGAGHTNGDTIVVYAALRVLQTGDLFAWKDAPFLDRGNGVSGVELPRTLAKALAGIKDVDTVIPGHHPVTTIADLQEYQRYNADLLTETQAAIKAGKSVDDATASSTVTAKYKGYKSERLKAAIQAIYDELKR